MRGDILLCEDEDELAAGSPPRARGHPHRGRRPHDDLGLTPACAGTSSGLLPPVGEYRAHPRVRGDIPSTRLLPDVYEGSPPRARGHPSPATVVAGVGGLTPACAGTSTGRAPSTSRLGAHPRVRGDIAGRQGSWGSGRGSPPRARGRRAPGCGVGQVEGLTPACAGTFHRAGSTDPSIGAHPRVRGDVASRFSPQVPQEGSPPRARGRRRCTRWRGRSTRAHPRVRGDVAVSSRSMSGPAGLTPACAGTSLSGGEGLGIEGAHPRVRGDVYCSFWWWWWRWGLTPACAGTSDCAGQRRNHRWAHPRVRGDVMVGMFGTATILGSPPRARGRRAGCRSSVGLVGLTPACAGTSHHAGPGGAAIGAHPRVRGDVAAATVCQRGHEGSPPRARGRLHEPGPPGGGPGLTPACAGTSRWKAYDPKWLGAHPRVRGDVKRRGGRGPAVAGSPPRARGRPACRTPAG